MFRDTLPSTLTMLPHGDDLYGRQGMDSNHHSFTIAEASCDLTILPHLLFGTRDGSRTRISLIESQIA